MYNSMYGWTCLVFGHEGSEGRGVVEAGERQLGEGVFRGTPQPALTDSNIQTANGGAGC